MTALGPVMLLAQAAALFSPLRGALDDGLVLGPRWSGAGDVRTAPPEVELDCVGARDACAFAVRIAAHVPAPMRGAFWAGGACDVTLEIDGAVVAPLPSGDVPADLATFERGFRGPAFLAPGDADPARPIAFAVGAGAHVMVLRGTVRLAALVRTLPERIAASDAVVARHLLFATPAPRRAAGVVVVLPARGIDPVRDASGLLVDGRSEVRAPASWSFEGRGDRACPLAATGLADCGAPDVDEHVVGEARVRRSVAARAGTHLVLGVRAVTPPEATLVTAGGPSIGAGWAFGLEDGLRLRLGYDAGLGSSGTWLGALAVETDAARRLGVVPLVLAGTRAALVKPSFGVGLGAPVALLPEPSVAGRLRLDAAWVGAGLAADLDVHAAPRFGATFALSAQVGL